MTLSGDPRAASKARMVRQLSIVLMAVVGLCIALTLGLWLFKGRVPDLGTLVLCAMMLFVGYIGVLGTRKIGGGDAR